MTKKRKKTKPDDRIASNTSKGRFGGVTRKDEDEASGLLRQMQAKESEVKNKVLSAHRNAGNVVPPTDCKTEDKVANERPEDYIKRLETLRDKFKAYEALISKSVTRKYGNGLKYYNRYLWEGAWEWQEQYELTNCEKLEKLAVDLEKSVRDTFAKLCVDKLAGLNEKQLLMAIRIGLPQSPGDIYFVSQRGGVAPKSWVKNKPLIEGDDEEYLQWVCHKINKSIQKAKTMEGPIQVDPRHFTNTETWRLLIKIMYDAGRGQVKCEERTLRSLKGRLKKIGKKVHKSQYFTLANNLKWKNGRARTEIPFGQIKIPQKAEK